MSDIEGRLLAINVHPVKSCAGIAANEAMLIETGLEFDRAWMLVDAHGEMLTQRQDPRLTLIRPTLKSSEMVLRAPGMLALHVRLDTVEAPTRVRVWDDIVKAYDMGALAAQWCSDFLGRPLRLARFDPAEKRLSNPQWTAEIAAENAFSDGFPVLVVSAASLDGLNARLAAKGESAVTMQRFRPNLVLGGLHAHDEDLLREIEIATDEGPVTLRLVKPCVRCTIPNVDPSTATVGSEPVATLAGYRADARMQGGITFGMNAIIGAGIDCTLRVGQPFKASWRFD